MPPSEENSTEEHRLQSARDAPLEAWNYLLDMGPAELELNFGGTESEWKAGMESGKSICQLAVEWAKRGPYKDVLENGGGDDDFDNVIASSPETIKSDAADLLVMEKRAQAAYRENKDNFPSSIWHCCSRTCFASIAIDPDKIRLFEELRLIHEVAERLHSFIKRSENDYVETRRSGVGGSYVGFYAPSRSEREAGSGALVASTDRQRGLKNFASFVIKVLPFLYGKEDAPSGAKCPSEKLCTEAICCLLGVSRKFLYGRKKMCSNGLSNEASDQELSSIIDEAGTRMRQRRRVGDRSGYPSIDELPTYDCGCSEPCLGGLNVVYLTSEYRAFSKCSKELDPRRKENRYLLNVMFCPLSHSSTQVCDAALSALYTVSEGHISDVRLALKAMCSAPDIDHHAFIAGGVEGYRKHSMHPMNRYPDHIREKVENHLDMVLRADPAGGIELNVCRVYSPEVNTKEKLRKLLRTALDEDAEVDEQLSDSTLQRIVNRYLDARNCKIEFNQKDHNACPNCKTLNYAVLQFHFEAKQLQQRYSSEFRNLARPFDKETQGKSDSLISEIETKQYQEREVLQTLVEHNYRDAEIRKTVKLWSDFFRGVENRYRELRVSGGGWNSMSNHAMITHQDDMTKVDLPHFTVKVSADITRWRFDVNAHVNAVTKEAIIFSHEQGTGAKNASAIIEMILIDHLLRCKGEAIKVVVSDNAAVGKNWLTTVALPQYMVDQGLADIVIVVFLENNHGKWLADMLFGQWQTRRKRSTLLSVDDLLREFEAVNCKGGTIQGFAANPLSSVDFAVVFESLGYETKPPKDFGFTKRNIHFTAACRQVAKQRLSHDVMQLLGPALPDDEGMVRISSSPPTRRSQTELPYEERFFDVPAACVTELSAQPPPLIHVSLQGNSVGNESVSGQSLVAPLVVPLDKPFASTGNGVVTQRTAKHVGFNGIEFRNGKGYPELRNISSSIVRQAWPLGLLRPFSSSISGSGEPVYGGETAKCAPENWVIRRPVSHFGDDRNWKARYPPRNLLNSRFSKGPRSSHGWLPTQTYAEPCFPVIEGKAACQAIKNVAVQQQDLTKSTNVLDLLREVYRCMGDREGVTDAWFQLRVTVPEYEAVDAYKNALQHFKDRRDGEPSAPRTIRQVFKKDDEVGIRVTEIMQERRQDTSSKTLRNAVYSELFEKATNMPGGLDRYIHLVEKDQERYARELKVFKEKLKQFDRDHAMNPRETLN